MAPNNSIANIISMSDYMSHKKSNDMNLPKINCRPFIGSIIDELVGQNDIGREYLFYEGLDALIRATASYDTNTSNISFNDYARECVRIHLKHILGINKRKKTTMSHDIDQTDNSVIDITPHQKLRLIK